MWRAGGLIAVGILAGCTAVSPAGGSPSSEPANPSVGATTPVSPSPAGASVSAAPPSPSAPSSGYVAAAPNGRTVADLAGSWAGELLLPPGDAPASTTWATRLKIDPCAQGDACGAFHIATAKAGWSGKAESCDYEVTYLGYQESSAAFVFGEKVTGQSGHRCYQMLLYVTPLASGEALGAQQFFGESFLDSGILRRSATP